MAYAVMLLASRDDIQDWVAEELHYHLKESQPLESQYEFVFPELKGCLAVLLETLRLYNTLPGIPKYTAEPQTLDMSGKTTRIPSDTLVIPTLQALHTHPKHWGQESLEWEPRRWIVSEASQDASDLGVRLAAEQILEPVKGAFVAWSEEVRNCLGKKFAQVEFVAVMATLFPDHMVWPVQALQESALEAKRRVANVVKDSKVELLLEMRNAKSVIVA